MPDRAYDFHLHTQASDGAFTAAEALRKAALSGLSGISITDHDTLDAYSIFDEAPLPPTNESLPRVLPGIEISTRLGEEEAHILGYFPGGFSPAIREYVEAILQCRRDRMAMGIAKLRERGIDISSGDCERLATGRVISRSVIAALLVEKRYIGRAHRAYPDYVGPKVVPLPNESAAQAVTRIGDLGGVSIWAHPGAKQIEAHLEELREAGLEGVEVLIPRRSPAERQALAEKIRAMGLLVTGGSDWHGRPDRPDLGRFRVAGGLVVEFLRRVGWENDSSDRASISG